MGLSWRKDIRLGQDYKYRKISAAQRGNDRK